ncbi:MFS transporter [Arthrobacter sp. ISL-5]|uniref:MFS transporter n=1 Tax=Arthrobacter sp. ISL-5 TaxID=2819111 RepID=UPI001BE56D54|nr:MFS transporter [Arthrobacter sp. ISL-5]MBT2554188.1 MHS family MFS transporter [Arthrobacter sp. ISL-5]
MSTQTNVQTNIETKKPSRATLISASLTGTTIEYFDFFAYATAAALVFNKVFFPSQDPIVGTILAFGGIAVGFIARPFGAALFGHFGDKIGRKSTLVVTLSIMGFGTFGIGMVPSYDQIGVWAPILLMLLRVLQGLALGGEWGGAVLITYEHAKQGEKGALTSFPSAGMPLGLSLSTVCFVAMAATMPSSAFEAWGWRVPFIIGVALVIVGLFIRTRIPESEEMIELKKDDAQPKVPIGTLFRTRTMSLVLCALAFVPCGFYFYAAYTFGMSYGKDSVGYSYDTLLMATLVFAVIYFVSILGAGAVSDKLGRKNTMYVGYGMTLLTPIPFFAMLGSGNGILLVLGFVLAGVANGVMYGPYAALLCESFEPRVRYTGISLGLTLGGVLGSAFSSMLFAQLFKSTGSWMPIALLVMGSAVVSAVAVAKLKHNPAPQTLDRPTR